MVLEFGALGGWRDISGLGLPGDIALNEVDYILRKARYRASGSESDSPCQIFLFSDVVRGMEADMSRELLAVWMSQRFADYGR